jgi:hypothetical protein
MYGEIKIDKKLFGTITRTTPMGAQRIEMPFKVCVVSHTGGLKTEKLDQCAKEVESAIKSSSEQLSEPLIQAIIDKTPNCKSLSDDEKKQITKFLMDKLGRVPTATTKCEQGKTGTEAAALGLGRLPFSWQFDETKAATKAITKTTCDEGAGNKYCDATQFTIELVKKSVDIQDKISGWKNTMKTANSAIVRAVMQVPTSTKSLDAYENTKELYRWALKQVKIENKYYFEAANGILNKPIEADDTIKKQIEAVNQSSGQGAIDQMKTLLDTIASRPYNTDVFAEIEISTAADTKKLQAIDADTIKALGAIELKVNERYLMKFSAFKNLHEEIAKACAAAGTNCNDAATRITVSKTEISTAFLQKFLNSVSFKRGVMHTKDMDDATIDFVMNNAQPIDGINQLELKAVWAEIKSVSFLTTDNYTAKFIEDFEGYYKDPLKSTTAYNGFIMTHFNNKGFGFSGIKENAVTAGKYSVFINADFSKAKPDEYTYEIQLKNLAEPEGELKNNWFLYNSIDGQIGTANTRDYGMDSRNSDIVLVKDGDAATDAVTIIGKTTGTIVPYKWSVFSYIKNGKILEANGSKFEFTPSSAFKLELTSTSLASVTTLYDLANIAGASTPFINWIDNQEKAGLTCKSGGTTQYYGITTKPGTLKAPFFVPDSEFIDIILVCTDGASTLKATEIQVPSNISTSASSIDIDNRASNTKRIKLPSAAEARLHTVKDYLDAVNSEYVCIDSSNSSLALLWNKEKITK